MSNPPRVEVIPIEDGATTDPNNIIRFTAQVARVQTMADGGLRVILDFSETAIKQAGELMQAKQSGAILEIAAIAVIPERIDPLVKQLQESKA